VIADAPRRKLGMPDALGLSYQPLFVLVGKVILVPATKSVPSYQLSQNRVTEALVILVSHTSQPGPRT
jgi:hypothetical protein